MFIKLEDRTLKSFNLEDPSIEERGSEKISRVFLPQSKLIE